MDALWTCQRVANAIYGHPSELIIKTPQSLGRLLVNQLMKHYGWIDKTLRYLPSPTAAQLIGVNDVTGSHFEDEQKQRHQLSFNLYDAGWFFWCISRASSASKKENPLSETKANKLTARPLSDPSDNWRSEQDTVSQNQPAIIFDYLSLARHGKAQSFRFKHDPIDT